MKALFLSVSLNVALLAGGVALWPFSSKDQRGDHDGHTGVNADYDVRGYFSHLHLKASQTEAESRLLQRLRKQPKSKFLLRTTLEGVSLHEVLQHYQEGTAQQLFSQVKSQTRGGFQGVQHWRDVQWPVVSKGQGKGFFFFSLDCWGCLEWVLKLKEKAPRTVITLGKKWSPEKQVMFLNQLRCASTQGWDFESQRKQYQSMATVKEAPCPGQEGGSEQWKKEVVLLSALLEGVYQMPIYVHGGKAGFWNQSIRDRFKAETAAQGE